MEGDDGSSSPNSPFLLPIPSHHHHHANHTLLCGEVERQLRLAAPLVAASLLQYSLQLISAMFVGHLGELPLSAVSLASSFANVTGFSVLLGMGSALDTLCGQANGAKQFHMLGIHMQRAILVLFIASIPLSLVWAYTSEILMAVGQNPEITKEAGIYACWLIPGLFAYGLLQCHVRFLQSQSIVMPLLITSGVTTLLHILVCWILVYACGLGTKGAALATSISYWINVFLLAVYIKFSQACKMTWTGFSREAFHDILDFLRLAVPSTFMICLEYWSFEMVVLLSGLLPNPMLETSVLSISLNTMWMVYMIPTGLGSAVSVRVSNELGSGNPQAARLSVRAVVIISVIEGAIVAIATILMRNIWGYLYSNEREVVKYVSVLIPLLAISDFMDGIQCVLSGAARGLGWQKTCSYINLGAYYIVGFPSSILFAFVLHGGGKGLWMGIICALTVQVFVLLAMILRTDWDKETTKAGGRVHNSAVTAAATW
ncbi:protein DETOXIFICATION 16-like [Iris pallida]|uniref:Protein DETOXIFICATION n=1 Tax=Iris pallida TaxID=29817 RepID=A0AAX6DNP1_IRIPA|nr:protein DETOXIFICATION 16-like [Iris pallida]